MPVDAIVPILQIAAISLDTPRGLTLHEGQQCLQPLGDDIRQGRTFSDRQPIGVGKEAGTTDLLDAPDGPTVTSRIFALKNADPTEWRDRVQQEITGKDGGPIEVAKTLADLDDAERELLRQLVGKRAGGE